MPQIFTRTRGILILCGGACAEEFCESVAGIGGEHQGFADEKCVETGAAEADKVGVGGEAGLGDGDAVVGDFVDEFERGVEADFERFEVAIVDADDFGAGGESAVEFGLGVNFDERLHFQFAAEVDEFL